MTKFEILFQHWRWSGSDEHRWIQTDGKCGENIHLSQWRFSLWTFQTHQDRI